MKPSISLDRLFGVIIGFHYSCSRPVGLVQIANTHLLGWIINGLAQ